MAMSAIRSDMSGRSARRSGRDPYRTVDLQGASAAFLRHQRMADGLFQPRFAHFSPSPTHFVFKLGRFRENVTS